MPTGDAPVGGILRVAVPSPLRRAFDYLLPRELPEGVADALEPGVRVRVPFGRRTCVGVVLARATDSEVPRSKLRPVLEIIDAAPILPAQTLAFLAWSAGYFHHPIGEVVLGALPAVLRQGKLPPDQRREERWRQTATGAAVQVADLTRAPRQASVLRLLRLYPGGASTAELGLHEAGSRGALNAMVKKGWVEKCRFDPPAVHATGAAGAGPASPIRTVLTLNQHQAHAVEQVLASVDDYSSFVLDGVTGSGKTEVYLSILDELLARGRQALVMIPEIGLTPQIVARFRERLTVPVVILHSGLPDVERARAWLAAGRGQARVVIGTRSSVFVPLPDLGVIIIDEEHDSSFKQQDGFRYSARDLAVLRAQRASIPIVLGSATPSMETLHNVGRGRYRDLRLPARAGGAAAPAVRIVDLRGQACHEGLSSALLDALGQRLERGEQSLLFLNRRGFAPVLICRDCGWHGECRRCDANLVLHREASRLRCHHCGYQTALPETCPDCGSGRMQPFGLGTQRVAEAVAERFPEARIDRIDRDRVRRRGALDEVLERIHGGQLDILVGTQMLAKGHHFPNVTLVGILDGDGGLFGADFRAPERMAQLLVQVAGRAGRGDLPGEVLLQTHHPHHPLLRRLTRDGYRAFAEDTLQERQLAELPPFASAALLRAEAAQPELAQGFLDAASKRAERLAGDVVRVLGPIPAPMERRAGRFRAQLLLESASRGSLQRMLTAWLTEIELLPDARKVRWSLDVDPQDML